MQLFNQLEEEIEKTAQNLNKPSQSEKIVDQILKPDINAILAKARSSIENNQAQQLTAPARKQEINDWLEIDDGFWSEGVLSSSDTFDNELDLNPIQRTEIFFRDVPLTTSDKPKNPKIKVKSTPEVSQASRNPEKNNHLSQKSARDRRLEYDNKRRNRSKKTSLANPRTSIY